MEASINYFSTRTFGNPILTLGTTLTGSITFDLESLNLGMGAEGLAFLGVAYAASFLPGSGVPRAPRFVSWDNISITCIYPRNYDTGVAKDIAVPHGPDHANGDVPYAIGNRVGPNDAGEYTMSNIGNIPLSQDANALSIVAGSQTDWVNVFLHFLAAYQVKGAKKGFYSSFFKMKGSHDVSGEIFELHFPKLTSGAPDIMKNAGLRNLLDESKWTEYRTTFATTIGLYEKFFNEFPNDKMTFYSDNTIILIRTAIVEYWSEEAYRAIPERAHAVLYIFLEVTDQLVPNLWGPTKAHHEMPHYDKTSLTNYIRKVVDSRATYGSKLFTWAFEFYFDAI